MHHPPKMVDSLSLSALSSDDDKMNPSTQNVPDKRQSAIDAVLWDDDDSVPEQEEQCDAVESCSPVSKSTACNDEYRSLSDGDLHTSDSDSFGHQRYNKEVTATAWAARNSYLALRAALGNPLKVVPRATLESALRTVGPPSQGSGKAYSSRTQTQSGSSELKNNPSGVLALWALGTTLRWTARADGWGCGATAARAAAAFWRATHAWEGALQGRVRFRYVGSITEADVQLRPHKEYFSFFPEQAAESLLTVGVQRGDDEHWYYSLLHEVGYILGLRLRDDDMSDEVMPGCSRLLGAREGDSCVDSYLAVSPSIPFGDALALREAYDTLVDGDVVRGVGQCAHVTRTVRRMHPHSYFVLY